MKNFWSICALLIGGTIVFTSCEKDDPIIPNEEELITTVNYALTPLNGGNTVILSFRDLDGDGGDAPVIIGGTLKSNTVYQGVLELLNEAENPTEDITAEISEEAEEHQFFFASDLPGVTIVYGDTDANGNPIGLNSTLTTGSSDSGMITITLRHEPDKSAAGVSSGDITNAGGETDIEVSIPVDVVE